MTKDARINPAAKTREFMFSHTREVRIRKAAPGPAIRAEPRKRLPGNRFVCNLTTASRHRSRAFFDFVEVPMP
jgi:hypothetical protein